jgi:hypothetical protein
MKTDPLEILEDALSDVGVWRWWDSAIPDAFQVEFGGAQLLTAPAKPGHRPSGIVAIRFETPSLVAFLTRRGATAMPMDWPRALQEDRLKPFTLTPDCFSLRSVAGFDAAKLSSDVQALIGDPAVADAHGSARLFFMAHDVGLIVTARTMTVITARGQLQLAEVAEANDRWWEYWREYWARRGTAEALPTDYACEATIPLKAD